MSERALQSLLRFGPAIGYESIDVGDTAVGLTAPPAAHSAFITIELNSVRWRMDGPLPTATEGHEITDGGTVAIYDQGDLNRFRVIRSGGFNATIRVTFFGRY